MTIAHVVYYGSDGVATRKFCGELRKQGQIGKIAAALFHAQKSSSRAKVYHGSFRSRNGQKTRYSALAYERKGDFLQQLGDLLFEDNCGMTWGWGLDANQPVAKHVLYLDLPQGQVSLHSVVRFAGQDYHGEWDGTNYSEKRVVTFCDCVWSGCAQKTTEAAAGAPLAVEIKEVSNDIPVGN